MKNKYYSWTGLSLIAVIAGTIVGVYLTNPLPIGLSVFISYALYRQGLKRSRMRGKTDNAKILHSLNSNLIEFLGIFSAYFFSPTALPVVFAATSVGFEQSLHHELNDGSGINDFVMLGRPERIAILGTVLLAAHFNDYIVFYGMFIVGGAALIESGRQVILSLDW